MPEYLEKSQIKRKMEVLINVELSCGHLSEAEALKKANDIILDLPPREVEPITKAKWEPQWKDTYKCSRCGRIEEIPLYATFPRCRGCNALMDDWR